MICIGRYGRVRKGRGGGGREWYGALAKCGPLAEESAIKSKGPTKYDKLLQGFPSAVGNSEVSGKRYGLADFPLFHTQLAGWGGEGGRTYAPHSITLHGSGGCVPSPWLG
jgi:hypothetical protein